MVWTKPFRLAALAAAIALGLMTLYILPALVNMWWAAALSHLPRWVTWPLEVLKWLLALIVVSVPLTLRPSRIGGLNVPPGLWAGIDSAASWVLRGRLAAVQAIGAGLMLATWVPHYLTWPWWADTEYFALSAQSWDSGILPYRDLYDFNFPGPTYVHWLLGKVVGWGHPAYFNALDAALLIAFGIALAAWSRTVFGGMVPGLIGFLAVLGHYLNFDYALVAQRDWHATMLSVLGLLALEARRDRVGLTVSAVMFAAALTFRPHVVVLLPALLSAIDENAREAGDPWSRTGRAVKAWSAVAAAGLLLGAAPLVLAGIADDFLHWFRLAWFGGNYNRAASRDFAAVLFGQLRRWETGALLIALAALAVARSARRRTARTWFLALLFVLFYKPLSPVLHDYLDHPLKIIWSLALAAVSGWAMTSPRLVPVVRLLFAALFLNYTMNRLPAFCLPLDSIRAVGDMARGRDPAAPPPGCYRSLGLRRMNNRYAWEDYIALIAYLRTETNTQTFVANFFRGHPFPTVNGPVGRLTPFPSPGGILWLRYAAPGLEDSFVAALTRPRNVVVVWAPSLQPGEANLRLERLEQTIRRYFEPEARFGMIEVWRRKSEVHPDKTSAGAPHDPRPPGSF
jgi:hypothetical protein